LEAGEVKAWCRGNMANCKVPRHVLQFESLPVNASNKVQKRDLQQIVGARILSAGRQLAVWAGSDGCRIQ
jgi:acyl-coenzyme A synthetase/AMP-(fatty) acid ligase